MLYIIKIKVFYIYAATIAPYNRRADDLDAWNSSYANVAQLLRQTKSAAVAQRLLRELRQKSFRVAEYDNPPPGCAR